MIVLQASHIQKQYDGHEVLRDASLVVQSGDHVALVGANGAGKSTLLRIVTGHEQPDAGDVSIARNANIGYVSQFIETDGATTVFNYVAETFSELTAMERKLRAMEEDMARPEVYGDERRFNEVSTAYDSLRQAFADANGYAVEARVRRVLDGLRFPPAMHAQSVSSLSGGQKTRLSLAKLLAWEPDLLILDEPTNYLDTDTITWLEGYLSAYEGALLLVSHDRWFLDKTASRVTELEDGATTDYTGNYSRYIELKASQFEQDLKRYESQQKEIARMETFIQKNLVRATTTKRAQSRRNMLERMIRLEKPNAATPRMAMRFTIGRESGKDVLRVENVKVGYPGKSLPGPLNFYMARGWRVAILGPNGIGKTSFLKALTGKLQPLQGSVEWGAHVQVGWYDQEQANLHPGKTVLQEIWDDFPALDMTTIRTALGRFLFRGEEVEKPVSALSGGERSRVSLCRLMLQQPNVLVMDEPTNHLDLMAKEVLEDALQDYEGTLLFVSHDRYFIDALATHVLVLSDDGFRIFLGNYSDYMQKVRDEEKWRDEADEPTNIRNGSHPPTGAAAPPSQSGKRQIRSADLRKLRSQVEQLEVQISTLEERQTTIGQALTEAAMAQDVERTLALQEELRQVECEHTAAVEAWESAAVELEELESGQ